MKKIISVLVFFGLTFPAFAQVSIGGLVGLGMSPELAKYFYDNGIALTTTANNSWIVSANATPAGATVKMIKVDAANNTHLNALTGKVTYLDVNQTPVAQVQSDGINFTAASSMPRFPAASVITPSTSYPTPNAGDSISNRFNALATAAPTAVFVEIPIATANVGKTFTLWNQGASPAQMVPISGDQANVLAAGTPYACATGKLCDCTAIGNTQHICISK